MLRPFGEPLDRGAHTFLPGGHRRRALQVMRWIEEGTLDVLIDRTYPLGDATSAHRDLESQETVGKLLLIP